MQEQDKKREERRELLVAVGFAVALAAALTLILRNFAWMLEL